MQDWDLILTWLPYEKIYLEFAADDRCPSADYFLALLYLIIGDAVRTQFASRSKDDLMGLLKLAEREFPKRPIFRWVQRSRILVKNPEMFRYDDWCAGGLAGRFAE